MTKKVALSKNAKTSLHLVIDNLESWIIEEPSIWGSQLYRIMNGDLRILIGRSWLKKKLVLSEDEWPETFRQTEQSEEEDLQEL